MLVSRSRSSYALAPSPYQVMAGLVPAIHAFAQRSTGPAEGDARNKSGHNDVGGRVGEVARPNRNCANFGNGTLVPNQHNLMLPPSRSRLLGGLISVFLKRLGSGALSGSDG